MADNTLFLRLAGPMQSWGTQSKLQLRRSDLFPSKSGVLGLLLACKGIARDESDQYLPDLNALAMGVRIDEPGTVQPDYHTAGAKIGIRQPKDGKVKCTEKTKLPEVQLSRRQYLWGASFLVALQGEPATIEQYAQCLNSPVWPPYLGRKCCIPSEPVLGGTGDFADLEVALSSVPWKQPHADPDQDGAATLADRECWIEAAAAQASADTKDVYDLPKRFGYWNCRSRRIRKVTVTVELEFLTAPDKRRWTDPYGPQWQKLRKARLEKDGHLCVFCQSPATDVHHTDYQDVRTETLRSLCRLCHDACTMLEYAQGDSPQRVDPLDPDQAETLLVQVHRILEAGRQTRRRRELLSRKGGMA